jgi:predicted HicB family RNase H-like nuclease
MGRPPVAKKLAKASLLSVRLSQSERKTIENAARRDGVKLSEWARKTLLEAAS